MVERFVKGRYYRYGKKEHLRWLWMGEMLPMADGRARKCLTVGAGPQESDSHPDTVIQEASFEGIQSIPNDPWWWDVENFIDCSGLDIVSVFRNRFLELV